VTNAQVTSVFTARETMVRTLKNIESSASRLDRTFGSLRGRVRSAFEFQVVARGMQLFEQGVHRVVTALPDLINRGEQWAATVGAMIDATGMSAEQSSELAAVQRALGGTADSLSRGFVALARSVYTNRDAWKDMGVEVATTRDGGVDAYETFQNLRRAISTTGNSLLSTAAAQKALGRGGRDLLDLLNLTDRQYRILAEDARRSGLVMSDAAERAAEAWERARGRFQGVLDGLGTKILTNLAPVLTRFVDGFTTFVQSNMDQIVRLVVGGANTILTIVGDLLGIDMGKWSFSETLGRIGRETPQVGAGLRDMSRAHKENADNTRRGADAARAFREQQQRLREELGKAYGALYRTQQQTTFFGGMSNVEIELWRQAKAQRIKDAEDRVSQARKALSDHRQTMARMTEVTARAAGRMRRDLGGVFKKDRGGKGDGVFGDIDDIIRDSTRTGLAISRAIKTAIFGNEQTIQLGGGAPIKIGAPGLIGTLQDTGRFLGEVGGHIGRLNDLLGGPAGLIAGVIGLKLALPLLGGKGPGVIPGVMNPATLGGLAGLAMVGGPIGLWLVNQLNNDRPFDPKRVGPDRPMAPPNVRWPEATRLVRETGKEVASAIRGVFTWTDPEPGAPPAPGTSSGAIPPSTRMPWDLIREQADRIENMFPTPGAGVGSPWELALKRAFDASNTGRAMVNLPTDLGNLSTTISALAAVIGEGGGGGGGGGGGTGLTQVTQRVSTLENQMNSGAPSFLTSRINTAFSRINDPKKGLNAISDRLEQTRFQAIMDGGSVDKRLDAMNSLRIKGDNAIKTVNKAQGQLLNAHEARIDRLEERAGIGGPDSRAQRRTASNSDQMVSLLRDIRRELRGGRSGAATSSLRATA
jgi:hypothetical protein